MLESAPVRSVAVSNVFLPKTSNSHMQITSTGMSIVPNKSCVRMMFKPKLSVSRNRLKMERFSENLSLKTAQKDISHKEDRFFNI